jgi:hypothetical protein
LAYDGSGWEIGLPAGVSDQIVYVLDSIRLHRHQHAKKSLPKSAKKPNQKRHFILILYEQFKELSESTGIIFLIFGVIFLVLAVVLLQVNSVQEVASRLVFPTALATISLGIGFIAVGVTVKSDKRYSELLGRILHQVEDLPYKLGDKVRLPSVLGDYSKEAAQKRLDEDTKNNRGQPRGELFEVEKGKWAIYWGGKYPL